LKNDHWTLFNAGVIWYFASSVIISSRFVTFLLTAQMLVQIAFCLFIRINVLVDPFMTDGYAQVFFNQPETCSGLLSCRSFLAVLSSSLLKYVFGQPVFAVLVLIDDLALAGSLVYFVSCVILADRRFIYTEYACDFGCECLVFSNANIWYRRYWIN
jgi:hypothetical protein